MDSWTYCTPVVLSLWVGTPPHDFGGSPDDSQVTKNTITASKVINKLYYNKNWSNIAKLAKLSRNMRKRQKL